MLKWLIRRKLRAFERANNYDASYMHEVLTTDVSAFLTFSRATNLNKYRKDVPPELYYAATLTSSVTADCGPCTQLGVGFALGSGVAPATVAAIIKGDEATMSPDVALGVRFARAVLARDVEVDALREEITRRFGPRAVLTLAFGVMASQLYPALKYALGHGKACTRVVIAGQAVAPGRLAVEAA
jgi:hypothetical protein